MSLEYCYCDGEGSYPFYERPHVARKEHRCYECGGKIPPGVRYTAVGGLCAGQWWHAHICSQCQSAIEWVKAHIPCVCFSYGNMREELTEVCRSVSREAPGLLFGFYRRLIGKRRHEHQSHR